MNNSGWPLQTSIDDLGLSIRTHNRLKGEGIKTVGEALAASDAKLLRMPNFGRKSLTELSLVLARGPVLKDTSLVHAATMALGALKCLRCDHKGIEAIIEELEHALQMHKGGPV